MGNKAEKAKAAKKSAKLQRQQSMVKKAVAKPKKKKWVQIFSPPFFGEQLLGESLVAEAQDLMGRKISVSMMNLTREVRKQAVSVQFEVIQTKGAGVQAAMVGFELAQSAARRLVRKGKSKITDSFLTKTKDEKIIRIKPFTVARGKVPNSLQTKIRLQAREMLANEAAKLSYQKLLEEIVAGRMQRQMKIQLQKSYPLSACEIRMISIERSETPLELGETVMEMPKRAAPKKRVKSESEEGSEETSEEKSEEKSEEQSENAEEKPKAKKPRKKKESDVAQEAEE